MHAAPVFRQCLQGPHSMAPGAIVIEDCSPQDEQSILFESSRLFRAATPSKEILLMVVPAASFLFMYIYSYSPHHTMLHTQCFRLFLFYSLI